MNPPCIEGRAVDWERYEVVFRREAEDQSLNQTQIERCLDYAKVLAGRDLPIIYDSLHLSGLVGYSIDYLNAAAFSSKKFYRVFELPKKAGGIRTISVPLPNLMSVQRWILKNILNRCHPTEYAKAFWKGRSIRENARFHRKQNRVLSLDIENFFPSIKIKRIVHLFRKLGYHRTIAGLLARLCCLENRLPQGAPSSPALSNLVCMRIDSRIAGYAMKKGLRYTRYADDITISGTFDSGEVISFVRKILAKDGFRLRDDKIRIMLPHQRQLVTGVVVNEKLNVPREIRREIRKASYYIEKYGFYAHLDMISEKRSNYLMHIRGVASHILFINPNEKNARKLLEATGGYLLTHGTVDGLAEFPP